MVLAATAEAAAPQAAPQLSDEIVISGHRMPSRPVVERFVRNAATPVGGQLAAYREPICPEVLGMDVADAVKVIDRMYAVAKSARVPFGKRPCSANFTVIIAADGRTFMQDVSRKRGRTLDSLTVAQRRELLSSPGPAWSWRTIGTHTTDGFSNAPTDPALTTSGGTAGGGGTGMTGMPTRSASLFRLQVRQDVGDAYVVIDENALAGKDAIQIADYALMRGIAGAQPSEQSREAGSVLSLFDAGTQPPKSLSYLDLAFLTTLYELPMDLPYAQQVNTIASRISRYNTVRDAKQSLQENERQE